MRLYVLLIVVLLAAVTSPAQSSPAAMTNFSFMTGNWVGESNGVFVDEYWSPATGDSMVGMFRIIKAGKIHLYELLTIELDGKRPILRLRHYGPGLVAREQDAITFQVAESSETEAVFVRADLESTRLIYRKKGNDALEAVLQKVGKDGKMTAETFIYKRAK
jgi:hypothetical protein